MPEPIYQQLYVNLAAQAEYSYPIYIGTDLLERELISKHISGNQVLIVSNEVIASHYQSNLIDVIKQYHPNIQLDTIAIAEGEKHKTLDTFSQIIDCLMVNQHNRTTTLIALGGGIVGDICSFAAAAYQRGVNFIQVPTTLLAQVDSSVGGKTGVNHSLGKNMIGAFHQPQAVIIDTTTLKTLPKREFNAGIAEIIKYGLIYDRVFFDWLLDNSVNLVAGNDSLDAAIKRSCEIKAAIVATDEREAGQRALLNFGHTFGHAIEALTQYKQLLHGEAVAIGMLMAADFSYRLGTLSQKEVTSVHSILQQFHLPTNVPGGINKEQFLNAMRADKKTINGKLRFITLNSVGNAIVNDNYSMDALLQTLDNFT